MTTPGHALLEAHVSAPADEAWALLRRFGEVGTWNPFLAESRIVGGGADRVGAVREVVTKDGDRAREELLELDDERRALAYRMLTFPIPVIRQGNRIVVTPSGKDGSVVTFSAEFEPERGTPITELVDINRGAFSAAAGGIGRHLGVEVVVVGR